MRQKLINYRGLILTQDAADALTEFEKRASDHGKWILELLGPVPGCMDGDHLSLIPAGREVRLTLTRSDISDPQIVLNAVWAFAVPLGFVPWNRYPFPSLHTDTVFHFYGPWGSLVDRLLAEGRGHLVWPSVCCAAQCDVGAWQGDKTEERFVQAQLHRIGRNCGPIDGIIGERTVKAISSLGLEQTDLTNASKYLKTAEPPPITSTEYQKGQIVVPGRETTITAVGDIRTQKTERGALLHIQGSGRVIVDVGVPK